MPSNYTPVPGNAPAVITVPSDLDDATAESVNLAFRALADNLMGLSALLGQPNVFTDSPLIFNVPDSSKAALVSTALPQADANPANIWKAQLGFNIGTYYVNVYSGRVSGTQQFIIAVNGLWDPALQHWVSDDAAYDSMALILATDSVRVSHRGPGAGSWVTWPTTSGDLFMGGSAFVGGGISAALADITGDCTAGDFLYPLTSTISRITAIPLCAQSNGGIEDGTGDLIMTGTISGRLWTSVAVRLVAGAVMQTLQIIHTDVGNSFSFVKDKWDFTAGTDVASGIGPGTTATVGGYQVTTISLSGQAYDPEAMYRVRCTPGTPGNRVKAIRLTWDETTGPRND